MLCPALYYPYIHFRDVNWLKASVLYFQQIRRIVPTEFTLNDSEEVRAMHDQKGMGGEPLILEEPASTEGVWKAQERLLERLQAQPPEFLDRFVIERVREEYDRGPQTFQMHCGKMPTLIEFLREHKLAWQAEGVRSGSPEDWLALHPRLGEAIMSIIAVAIAREKGLGIVTSSGTVHRALAEQDEELVFHELAGISTPTDTSDGLGSMRDDLGLTVLLSCFDVSRLTAAQVAELVREGKDLSRFKQRLDDEIRGSRLIQDADERKRRLEHAAREIVAEWNRQRASLPSYALDALIPLADGNLPTVVTTLIAGATGIATLGLAVGLAITFAAYAGMNARGRFTQANNHPLNYLSRLRATGAAVALHP